MPRHQHREHPGEAVHAEGEIQAERGQPGEVEAQHLPVRHLRVCRPCQSLHRERDGPGEPCFAVAGVRGEQRGGDAAGERQSEQSDQQRVVGHGPCELTVPAQRAYDERGDDLRRPHHRHRPGRSGPRRATVRRRQESRRGREGTSSAAPASTTAARRPRRWSRARTPRTWRGAPPTTACSSDASPRIDMKRVKARKDRNRPQLQRGRREMDGRPEGRDGLPRARALRRPQTIQVGSAAAAGRQDLPRCRRPAAHPEDAGARYGALPDERRR